jgi:hypothetical protein
MITGIPKNIPFKVVNKKFRELMEKMFTEKKVMNAKVIGKFNTLYTLC